MNKVLIFSGYKELVGSYVVPFSETADVPVKINPWTV